MSFENMRKSRSKEFDALTAKLQKMNEKQSYSNDDDRYWKLEVDKAGNGYAVIRFLPGPDGENLPFTQIWNHGFKGPNGQWYIENSLTTLGKDDPVSEYNSKLWNSVDSDNTPERKQARDQKRRLQYISNVYVVKDSKNPENEGKVFLYKYGKKIFDKLNAAMNPVHEDETAFNPFDMWDGADFKLRARMVDGYRNYGDSVFEVNKTMTAPNGQELSDEELKKVYESQHSLAELVSADKFKSYDELKARLHLVLGLDGGSNAPTSTAESDDVVGMDFKAKFKETPSPQPKEKASTFDDDDDDTDAFFNDLMSED